MQPDFMSAAIKVRDFIAAGYSPEVATLAEQSGGNVEGAARAVCFQHRSAGRVRTIGNVVECETDERFCIAHPFRGERQVPGKAMGGASR
jgi:hypothetical protein